MFHIYGTERCGFCDKAKELLESFDILYSYQDVTTDQGLIDMFKMNGWKTVPQIFEEEKYIGGYSELVKYLKKYIMEDRQ